MGCESWSDSPVCCIQHSLKEKSSYRCDIRRPYVNASSCSVATVLISSLRLVSELTMTRDSCKYIILLILVCRCGYVQCLSRGLHNTGTNSEHVQRIAQWAVGKMNEDGGSFALDGIKNVLKQVKWCIQSVNLLMNIAAAAN